MTIACCSPYSQAERIAAIAIAVLSPSGNSSAAVLAVATTIAAACRMGACCRTVLVAAARVDVASSCM